jgi:pilus assembly protein TadC
MGEDLKEMIREIELKKIIREMEERDLRKIIKEMEEKKEEDLKKKFELLNKFFLLSSPLALIVGSLWFLIYLILIVKDFPPSIEKSIFYYIFAIFICLIIFIIYPLMSYLYIKIIEENNLERENKIVNKIEKFFQSFFFIYLLYFC